ncbi:MAG: TetR/AcrR family transcriptional regulator [Bacteroidales bacterium]|jgi:AcrR family transcriptional regulator|nr:TetR/AcrR family transcriptional regulator [Bacteroidales bacterium]
MAQQKAKEAIDASTEEKIKNAARTVFQKKGYAAARTRDIAEEAGINLALLNYYFRSKEKLFELIIIETFTGFYQSMVSVINDDSTDFKQKLELFVTKYINLLLKDENIPFFILGEIRNHPEQLFDKISLRDTFINSVYYRQFNEEVAKGAISESCPVQFMMNVMGLVIFPFLARPLLKTIGGMKDSQYNQLMQERKRLIPVWIDAILSVK